MKTANPQLFEALENAPLSQSHTDHWNSQMKLVAEAILNDQFMLRGPSYNRNVYTVAALLAHDPVIRDMAINAGINIRVFDDIVNQVKGLVLTHSVKPPPAGKIANVLCKLTGVPF